MELSELDEDGLARFRRATVMAGTLAASRYQRLYESVILRTPGATRATVARAFAVEYACLGLAAGVGGALLASVLAWIVLRFVLEARRVDTLDGEHARTRTRVDQLELRVRALERRPPG